MPANSLAPRDTSAAVRAAVSRGNTRCTIMLIGGTSFDFTIESVIDGGLVGQRTANTGAIVFFDAIAMIEFPQ